MQSAVLGRGPGDCHSAERLAANWHSGLVADDQVGQTPRPEGLFRKFGSYSMSQS